MSNYYLCPRPFSKDYTQESILGWAKEAVQMGRTYLRLQPAYPFIQEGMDLINGELYKGKIQTLSSAKTELVVRNIKELVAAQTNIRIIPAFSTESATFREQNVMLNKTYMCWQTMVFADRAWRKAWQYAAGGGTGYLGIRWEPNYWYNGKGEIVLDAYGPMDVLPVGLPRSHDLQKAYLTVIRVETPYHELIRRYPEYADKIKPSRENSKGRGNVVSAAVKYASAVFRKFGPGSTNENEPAPWGMCDAYHIYIDDDSINYTDQPLLMGDPDTSWEYTVPYIGQQIHYGNDAKGNKLYREAKPKDCMIYPNRRKIVCTDDVVLTPDPYRQVNEYWHGKVPVSQLRADDWAWNFLGFPLTKSGVSLEKANIDMLRGVVDMVNNRLSPARAYDKQSMSQALAQTLNTRIPNQVVGMDLSLGQKPLEPLLPPEYLNIPALIPEFMEQIDRRITHQMGVQDAAALSRARQLPSGDSVERIMESMGPLIKDQSRNMESTVCANGEMWKSLVFQFYQAPRLMQILGEDGVPAEIFEAKIGDMIPEKVAGVLPDAPYLIRARQHSNNFTFTVTPYSLHELNSITRKLFHLQLMRAGFPVDWWTLADVFDIKNFGPKPQVDDPNNPGQKHEAQSILECWLAQQEMLLRFKAAEAGAAAQASPQPGQAGQGGAASPPASPGTPSHTGRPPSGQAPPVLEQKTDGRSTIRESQH